jgi:hypothetical protein
MRATRKITTTDDGDILRLVDVRRVTDDMELIKVLHTQLRGIDKGGAKRPTDDSANCRSVVLGATSHGVCSKGEKARR